MTQLQVTQVRSTIGGQHNQRQTLRTLGLGRIGDITQRPDDPQTRGMLRAVAHLVEVTITQGSTVGADKTLRTRSTKASTQAPVKDDQ